MHLARFKLDVLVKAGLVFTAMCVFGCSESDGRYGVSGTVKLNGQDLDQGRIAFHPAGEGGQPGGAAVIKGLYKMPPKQGLLPGKYKVSISSPEGGESAAVEMPGESNVMLKDRVPEKYNAKTELTAEITDGGKNEFNFDLK